MVQLSIGNHDRDVAGLTYIYPVISRRSGGLSIGVNVNTNNACNWRCIYCQVPGLIRGAAPTIDWELLQDELKSFLDFVQYGDFYQQFGVPDELRVIKDIAISGNGEATSLSRFEHLISLVGDTIESANIQESPNMVLISNGSLMHQAQVQSGLQRLSRYNGQVWFKVDSATAEGLQVINNAAFSTQKQFDNLVISAGLCPTWLQTCLISINGELWHEKELESYLSLLKKVNNQAPLQGVLLYSLARPSMQPEADSLSAYPSQAMLSIAEKISALGIDVKVND